MPYFNKGALGATYDPFKGEPASNFGWVLNLPTQYRVHNSQYGCGSKVTGKPYTGGLTTNPCTGSPPASSGGGAVLEYLKQKLLPQTGPGYGGPGGAPTTTASNLLLPAVAVVGVVGLVLILRKKK